MCFRQSLARSRSMYHVPFCRGHVRWLHLRGIHDGPGNALPTRRDGHPITDVNKCLTGSAALVHAATLVRACNARSELSLSFERVAPGTLGTKSVFRERSSPVLLFLVAADGASLNTKRGLPIPRVFGVCQALWGWVEHLSKIG